MAAAPKACTTISVMMLMSSCRCAEAKRTPDSAAKLVPISHDTRRTVVGA